MAEPAKNTTAQVELNAEQPAGKIEKQASAQTAKTAEKSKLAISDEEINATGEATKRQKVSEFKDDNKKQSGTAEAEETKKDGAGAVVGDDSEDFEEGQDGDDDSFDDDFDAADEEDSLSGGDDYIDLEAYLKWRAENPDDVNQEAAKAEDPGAELPEGDDSDGDDYDDEDD